MNGKGSLVLADVLATDLLKAFGLDLKDVTRVSLDLRAGELATLEVTRTIRREEFKSAVKELSEKYVLFKYDSNPTSVPD